MGRPSDAKQRLMSAVLELIWQGSYGTTTIDLICERAAVKKGSFYHFFASKSELTAAALDDAWEGTCRAKLDAVFSPSIPPLERLKLHAQQCYEEQVELKAKHGHVLGCPLHSLGNEVSTQETQLRQVIEKVMGSHQHYVESAIRDAKALGLIICPDVPLMAKTLFIYVEGALGQARIKNDPEVLRDLPSTLLRLLGVVAPARAARKRSA
jgi:TetR/AcrR family transcriptional regulator, transcriptional repressor for nem operon